MHPVSLTHHFLDSPEALPAAVLHSSPLALYVQDHEGRIRLWNRAAEKLFGWTEGELVGEEDPTFAGGGAGSLLNAVLGGNDVRGRVERRLRRDGSLVDVSIYAGKLASQDGVHGVITVLAQADDRPGAEREFAELLAEERSAREQAEAAARHSRLLAEVSSILDGTLDYASTLGNLARLCVPSLADFCAIDELEDDHISRVAFAHVDDAQEEMLRRDARQPLGEIRERHPAARVMLTGESIRVERVDDEVLGSMASDAAHMDRLRRLQLHSLLVVPLSSGGNVLGAVTLAFGRSRRRYAEADLTVAEELGRRAAVAVHTARLYRESRRAVRARERLMAIVSHDLRNSLATVLLNASAVVESSEASNIDPGVRDQLQWIARSAEQMNRLISDLLDVSAIELDRLSLEPKPHRPQKLIDDAVETCGPLAADRRLLFSSYVAAGLPSVLVDAGRIQQVLGNLLGNAIKFTAPGGSVRLTAVGDADGFVRFTVADTGPGIDRTHLPAIFDLYWQADRNRKPRSGAGLGLAIAKAIVERHGGRIWAESEPGAGSSFSFTVPAEGGHAG